MPRIKDWISAARLRTLPLAFSCIFAGGALAISRGTFSLLVFSLTLVTTLCLQVLSNFANDLGDYLKGTDDDSRVGPERAIQSGAINSGQMKNAVIIMALASLVSGVLLLYSSGLRIDELGLSFLALGLMAIGAAIKYTAGNSAYGYSGLGDISVFLFFGLIGVLGSSILHDLSIPFTKDVFPAAGIGFLSSAVLNLNNMRDAIPDSTKGKRTMAVRLGPSNSKIYHGILIGLGIISLLAYSYLSHTTTLALSYIIVFPILFSHLMRVFKTKDPSNLDPELKKVAFSTFLISLLFLIGILF